MDGGVVSRGKRGIYNLVIDGSPRFVCHVRTIPMSRVIRLSGEMEEKTKVKAKAKPIQST